MYSSVHILILCELKQRLVESEDFTSKFDITTASYFKFLKIITTEQEILFSLQNHVHHTKTCITSAIDIFGKKNQ